MPYESIVRPGTDSQTGPRGLTTTGSPMEDAAWQMAAVLVAQAASVEDANQAAHLGFAVARILKQVRKLREVDSAVRIGYGREGS